MRRTGLLKLLIAVQGAAVGFAGTDHYLQVATNWREVDVGSEDTNIADERLESATSARASKNSLIGYG